MRRIGILGDIGSGKSYIANSFGYPVFNADQEVGEIYKKNKKVFLKLKKILPKYIYSYPINKHEITNARMGRRNINIAIINIKKSYTSNFLFSIFELCSLSLV